MINVDNIIEICVAIDIAILGIAYPIIVDKASNIGDKYQSQYLSVLFNYEFPQRSLRIQFMGREYKFVIFKLLLFLTILSFLFLIFKAEPWFGLDNWFINNSANIVVFIFSLLLTILFFIWLEKVILFNGKSTALLSHIVKRNDCLTDEDEARQYYLKAINEITYYAMDKQDEHLQETLLQFYYKTFSNIRRNHIKDKPLVYPVDLYFMVNQLNEDATVVQNRKLRAIEHRAVSGAWLLGEDSDELIISDETYRCLWRNIYTICDYPRLVKMFWAHSSQYFDYRLRSIPDYNSSEASTNSTKVELRGKERKRFLEFHYALGGLVYYRGEYNLLKYFFEYTQTQPPSYVLLPKSMTEIFSWFEHFRNDYLHLGAPIDFKYYFPELDNLGNKGQINYWICCYIALLFVQQFSKVPYYTYQNFTGAPTLPSTVLELGNWLESIPFFEKCLEDVKENATFLETLGLTDVVNEKKHQFADFLSNLKQQITSHIGQQKLMAELSPQMIAHFFKSSGVIIGEAFKEYQAVFTSIDSEHENGRTKLVVSGSTTLMSKAAFTENDKAHTGYDEVFAHSIVTGSIRKYIPNSFLVARTKRYLLKREDLIAGLSRLIGSNPQVLIVGVNLQDRVSEILKSSDFNERIMKIPSTDHDVQDVLYILRKVDLPAIEHRLPAAEEMTELQLEQINDEFQVYGSVIDINKPENMKKRERWNSEYEANTQDLKVQVTLAFESVIHWKDSREVIQLSITSEYREQGIPNNINDIKPLEEQHGD